MNGYARTGGSTSLRGFAIVADNSLRWRALNKMVQRTGPPKRPSHSEAMCQLDDAAEAAMLVSGYALDGMNCDLGWRFMSFGRRFFSHTGKADPAAFRASP